MIRNRLFQIFLYILIFQIVAVAATTIYNIKYSHSSLTIEGLTTKEMSRFIESHPVEDARLRLTTVNHLLYILGETQNQLEHKQLQSKLDNNSELYLQTLKSISYQDFLNSDTSKNMNVDCYKNATKLHDCIVERKLTSLSIEEYNHFKNILLEHRMLRQASSSLFDTISEDNSLKIKQLEIKMFSLLMMILNIAALLFVMPLQNAAKEPT